MGQQYSAAPAPLPSATATASSPIAPQRVVFVYGATRVACTLQLPIVVARPPRAISAHSTLVQELEMWLRLHFQLPQDQTVFAVVPAHEPYSPPYPLLLLNQTLAPRTHDIKSTVHSQDQAPLALALVVRRMALVQQPIARDVTLFESPFQPIRMADLRAISTSDCGALARKRLAFLLANYGFARLEVDSADAVRARTAYASARVWLAEQWARKPTERWFESVDATRPLMWNGWPADTQRKQEDRQRKEEDGDDCVDTSMNGTAEPVDDAEEGQEGEMSAASQVSQGRYVGFRCDKNREYIQMRRPIAASGTTWPRPYFQRTKQEPFAHEMLALVDCLESLSRDVLLAVCDELNVDRDWVVREVLDDVTPPPPPSGTEADDESLPKDPTYQFGASVLRVYSYRNKTPRDGRSLTAADDSCGVHADLGLLTVSPPATVPSLQMWNLDRMLWTDVESGAAPVHFSVFAGEALAFMTQGRVQAPLHRVPPACVLREDQRRMSMPFFLRARPQAVLNPWAEQAEQLTCRDLMEDRIMTHRPWRQVSKDAPPIDY